MGEVEIVLESHNGVYYKKEVMLFSHFPIIFYFLQVWLLTSIYKPLEVVV